MAVERPTSKGQAWFCTTGLPSDVIIEVDDMTFHLHKFPLMSKSRKLYDLIQEQEKNPKTRAANSIQQPSESETGRHFEIQEEEEEEQCQITITNFPGGSDTFETAAKFCYGVKIDLSASNVAALRCAAEYLEMTEVFSEDNLVLKTEQFFSHSVLNNIKHSVRAFTSCESLLPMADNLGIVQRCIEAIANRAAVADPSLFGWPVNDDDTNYKSGDELNSRRRGAAATASSWLDELGFLSLTFFKRLIFGLKDLDLNGEIMESCLIHYAKTCIPGISRTARKPSASSVHAPPTENEQREILETVISNIPKEKTLRQAANTTRLLFGLLRTAYILGASEASRFTLEKKIGSQLEQAALDDLLIPSYSYLNETLYDVDCVERILANFLQGMEDRSAAGIEGEDENSGIRSTALMLVGKLIDGYLSEIASDGNLKGEKFYDLAVALPDHARVYDDGLYRAVDVYLKAHSWISEAEREKICGILDYQKLTLEACTHAAQNERLPLRAVVQVLFFEQLQLRQAIAGSLLAADSDMVVEAERMSTDGGERVVDGDDVAIPAVVPRAQEGISTWDASLRENQVLRVDMHSMRSRVHELERECTTMKKAIEKMDRMAPRNVHVAKSGWRAKFGCKFKTQVCDSQEQTVVDSRKGRSHRRER